MTVKPIIMSRYTDLPSALYLLRTKSITLLDPRTWDDGNDSYFMSIYKEKKKLSSLLALCFTYASETYHHWRVFAPGAAGIRIEFLSGRLLGSFLGSEFRIGDVDYQRLRREGEKFLVQDLPFLKRYPYHPEEEFRIIYQSKKNIEHVHDVPIEISDIHRVVLSPWIHPEVGEMVRAVLRNIEDCGNLHVHRSTLVGNDEWKAMGDQAVKRRRPA